MKQELHDNQVEQVDGGFHDAATGTFVLRMPNETAAVEEKSPNFLERILSFFGIQKK